MPSSDVKTATRFGVQINQCHQHEQRAQQGIQKEFECRINLISTTPNTNNQVHRDQSGLKKHIKQQAV